MSTPLVRPLAVLAIAVALATPWASAQEPPVPTVTAQKVPGESARDFGGCSFTCATTWKTRVSSSLPPNDGARYDGPQLEDENEKTAWASRGKGEFIEVTFDGRKEIKDWHAPLRGFRLVNGYAKSPALFAKNSRVKTLRVDFNGKPIEQARLLDSPVVQAVAIPEMEVRAGDRVRLTIIDVYPGSTYKDTCISEIIFDGAH